MLKTIDKCLCKFENFVLIFGLISCSLLLFANVVLRYIFESGIVWAEEYTKFAIMWVTFAGCGAGIRYSAHMSITALAEAVNEKIKRILSVIVHIVGLIFSAFLLVYGAKVTYSVYATSQLSPAMEIPMYLVYISVPIGGALLIIRLIQSLVRIIKDIKEKDQIKMGEVY